MEPWLQGSASTAACAPPCAASMGAARADTMVRTRSERCGADEVKAGTADVVKTLRSNRIGCHATMPKGTDALHADHGLLVQRGESLLPETENDVEIRDLIARVRRQCARAAL